MNEPIYRRADGVETRWANPENPNGVKGSAASALGGRKGAPCFFHLKPGETRIMAEAKGRGVIRRIWITFEKRELPEMLKGYRLEFFWDGSEKPAVSVPLGDFFCFNSAKLSAMENVFFSNPEGRSFNCVIPMPFQTGMRVTITNETADKEEIHFFYQIDYTLGDDVSDALYFHAFYNREIDAKTCHDYTILPTVNGSGRFLGASFGVIANPLMGDSWWGEGEVKCYIDGDGILPTLAGTGTEDYIGTGWGQGRFVGQYQGCVHADSDQMRYSFYRFHVPDPVWFHSDLRVTIQQIGCAGRDCLLSMLDRGLEIRRTDGVQVDRETSGAIFERFGDDWCSVAYFYLDRPQTDLPPLPELAERVKRYL